MPTATPPQPRPTTQAIAASPPPKADGQTIQEQFLAAREALRRDINDHGIFRAPPGSQELVSLGSNKTYYEKTFYVWQFYLRACMLKAQHLTFIAHCFWQTYQARYRRQPFQISGVEQACVPIITALILTAPLYGINVHAFTVRKERKAFGLENFIEGNPNYEAPVMFIDDLTSPTHATLWHWIRIVTQARIKLYPRCFVVVYKGKRAELKDIAITTGNLGIDAIYTLDDFNMTWNEYQLHKATNGQN